MNDIINLQNFFNLCNNDFGNVEFLYCLLKKLRSEKDLNQLLKNISIRFLKSLIIQNFNNKLNMISDKKFENEMEEKFFLLYYLSKLKSIEKLLIDENFSFDNFIFRIDIISIKIYGKESFNETSRFLKINKELLSIINENSIIEFIEDFRFNFIFSYKYFSTSDTANIYKYRENELQKLIHEKPKKITDFIESKNFYDINSDILNSINNKNYISFLVNTEIYNVNNSIQYEKNIFISYYQPCNTNTNNYFWNFIKVNNSISFFNSKIEKFLLIILENTHIKLNINLIDFMIKDINEIFCIDNRFFIILLNNRNHYIFENQNVNNKTCTIKNYFHIFNQNHKTINYYKTQNGLILSYLEIDSTSVFKFPILINKIKIINNNEIKELNFVIQINININKYIYETLDFMKYINLINNDELILKLPKNLKIKKENNNYIIFSNKIDNITFTESLFFKFDIYKIKLEKIQDVNNYYQIINIKAIFENNFDNYIISCYYFHDLILLFLPLEGLLYFFNLKEEKFIKKIQIYLKVLGGKPLNKIINNFIEYENKFFTPLIFENFILMPLGRFEESTNKFDFAFIQSNYIL